jgi:hypothetical protein
LAAQASGANVIAARIHDNGELDIDDFKAKLSSRTKIVAFTHISNALGTILPAKELTQMAHAVGATVLIDGAQSGPHAAIDVQEIGADFYVLSIHKMYGPTGVGVLYGKLNLLEAMPPYQGGGSMIRSVSFEETTFAELPAKFAPWNDLWFRWQRWLTDSEMSAVQACLAFPLSFAEIDRVIVGADSVSQFTQILYFIKSRLTHQLPDMQCDDEKLIDPRKWPTF